MSSIFNPGKDARREAAAAAEKSRQQQQVANDRQLAELRSREAEDTTTRRNPRGRRLFVADAGQKTNLS